MILTVQDLDHHHSWWDLLRHLQFYRNDTPASSDEVLSSGTAERPNSKLFTDATQDSWGLEIKVSFPERYQEHATFVANNLAACLFHEYK
jgi:hypothetical protein